MRAAGAGLLLLGLSVVAMSAAGWLSPAGDRPSPPPALAAQVGAPPTPRAVTSYSLQEVIVPSRRGNRPGTLLLPAADGPHPGVVLVPGGDPGPRHRLLGQAAALASRGIATLVVDKNLAGYSWRTRDYAALADDALEGVRLLRARPEVALDQVGLWGHSEGGWVVASAAADDHSVAFVVLVSAPTVSPGEQASWLVSRALHRHRLGLLEQVVGRHLALGRDVITYTEHRPPLAEIRAPVLAVFGAEDFSLPLASAVDALRTQLPRRPTVQVYAASGHGLTTTAGDPPPGYLDRTADWIRHRDGPDLVETPVRQAAMPSSRPTRPVAGALLLASAPLALSGTGVLLLAAARAAGRQVCRRHPASREDPS